jgi:hypothetical protein
LGYGVAADDSGNVYVAGQFVSTVDFDPSGGTDEHTANGSFDIFLSKFDSSGVFQWARTWGGVKWDFGYAVATDGSGNVYMTGDFQGTDVNFNPGGSAPYSSNGIWDAFLSKFDSSGDFQWARTWGGVDSDDGYGVATDGSGNIYVTGGFKGTVDLDPGDGTDEHISYGNYDIFLSKFPPDGNW